MSFIVHLLKCFPGMDSEVFFKSFVTIPVAPIITGMIIHYYIIIIIIIILLLLLLFRPR